LKSRPPCRTGKLELLSFDQSCEHGPVLANQLVDSYEAPSITKTAKEVTEKKHILAITIIATPTKNIKKMLTSHCHKE
jgi:hypothetical protein